MADACLEDGAFRMLIFRTPALTIAALLIAVAYGITFPLLSSRLEATGADGLAIGINAAMPALGWIIGEMLVPQLQIRFGIPFRRLLQLFLIIAIVALAALRYAQTYEGMTALRLLYGGSMGVNFRCIEYWINDVSRDAERGRNIGIYSILFMLALIVGAALQPELGNQGWSAFGPPLLLACAGLLLLQFWNGRPASTVDVALPPAALSLALSMPVALLVVLGYGAYECAPTTMIPIYAVRHGLDAATGAYVLPAAAAGNILLQYPVTAASDRLGRTPLLLMCAATAVLAAALVPLTLASPAIFLAAVALLGAAAGASYSLALAMVGDRFDGARLVVANAAFGVVYAVGSLVGPLMHGLGSGQFGSHGLMISLALSFVILTAVAWASARMASVQRGQ